MIAMKQACAAVLAVALLVIAASLGTTLRMFRKRRRSAREGERTLRDAVKRGARRSGAMVAALALMLGAFLGTRLGPLLLPQGSSSPYAPAFGLLGALLAGALLATGLVLYLPSLSPWISPSARIDSLKWRSPSMNWTW